MADRHRVSCVDPAAGSEPHERIARIGGRNTVGVNWRLSQDEAVAAIETQRWDFYIQQRTGRDVDVVVGTTDSGSKYLKTTADDEQPVSLLALPVCAQ